ncbi:AAA family ATPase [Roseovarius autotrophicus]|uniref:AAA family ATPase n=1 Tax=Roseovarius autotrophicus TaxID=2824121 RepID=UPI001B379E88|nr:AAA family ATPase [Roseovarius autotrophicus]
MITRLEIDGFKTFENFSIDLMPFTAIVGPNASGKSNLFDVIRLLAELVTEDVRSAMTKLRGEPLELFRRTPYRSAKMMTLAVEVLLPISGIDQFGTKFHLKTQRIRYEVSLRAETDAIGNIEKVIVANEKCERIRKKNEQSAFIKREHKIAYGGNMRDTPFLDTETNSDGQKSFLIRQDGPNKKGRPTRIPAIDASRTGISTVQTAEFPHLYAVKNFLGHPSFLEISPTEARRENDRFVEKELLPSASNLAAVLDRLKSETGTLDQPDGILNDISNQISQLIPAVRKVHSVTSRDQKEYTYEIEMADGLRFSSRVISDGTLRILALVTLLNDPDRKGLLCFEEPENGIHEGRIPALIELIRSSTADVVADYFQVVVNTHSPAVMKALQDTEIVAADIVNVVTQDGVTKKTRMRGSPLEMGDLIDPEISLTRYEIESLLHRKFDAA